jgi:hypothetical protein
MPESWYGLVSGDEDLMQGDFIYECPIVVPAVSKLGEGMTIEATVRNYNVVILSQSCDMKYKKIKLVLVCPFWPLEEYAKKYTHLKSDNSKEALRRGYNPGHHLLAKCELDGFRKDDYLVVEFKSVFSVPLDYISEKAKSQDKRLRLKSPFREHLSQAFARFFMRVGLPADIPKFIENEVSVR